MSYRIQYGPPQKGELENRNNSPRVLRYFVIIAVATVAVFLLANPQAATAVRNFLLPGDPEVTEMAFSDFLNSLKGGSTIGQAITAFCREIIESA